ncbi:MAG: asparagine--tRNA ligase [Bdellovibrionales bacterium]
MMKLQHTPISDLLKSQEPLENITIKGWVRTKRENKSFSFCEMNDGSCLSNIQCIIDQVVESYADLKEVTTGAALSITGKLVESPGKGQKWELHATQFEVFGLADNSYPLQKKGHTKEFLREIAHLRPRTNLFGAVFRLRSRLAYAVHQFYQNQGFNYIHTPIITASDCEGAGELFKVSTFESGEGLGKDGKVDFDKDFFAKQTYLTVSGQLEVETFATALSRVYTFGPTFRAENSNTPRHAAEFWMIEPEVAFADINDIMDLAEHFVKYLIQDIKENCSEDLSIFTKFVDKNLLARLENVLSEDFARVEYTEAINILESASKDFEYQVKYGIDLQTEHERYLAEEHFKKPVCVYNYPKEIKPFYMKINADGKTVGAMDLIVPGIGELIGGSQREENLDILLDNLKAHDIDPKEYWWYTDTRKFGSVPHSGFGLGFERLIMFVTGMQNIRDVIPFPRTPRNCEF